MSFKQGEKENYDQEREKRMIYAYLTVMTLALALTIYLFYNQEDKEENIMEDFPNIYVNSEELKRHAVRISTHFSETKRISSKGN